MRAIQFRAWDASEKEMVEWPHLLNDPDDWLLSLLNDPGEDVLMQFTGLKDKNGKEIYEGDICSQKYYASPVVITFEDGAVAAEDVYLGDPSLEVIGNIYENLELLTP
jgi:hypothetical protein